MAFEVNPSSEAVGKEYPQFNTTKKTEQPAQNIDLHFDNKFKTEKSVDLLTETTASMLGATFSTKPRLLAPTEHPEIKALSKKLSEYVGVPHISPEIAAEINKTADLSFATNEMVKTNGVSLEKDIAKFTPKERLDVTRAFQAAQVREAMRRIAETPDDVQARIGQDFMANFA